MKEARADWSLRLRRGLQAENMALRLKAVVVLACFISVIGLSRADEDVADGEDGYMDTEVRSAVIESCAG